MNTTTWSDLREVELFLFREAELADQNEYTAWSALWTEQLTYWVPCNSDALEPAKWAQTCQANKLLTGGCGVVSYSNRCSFLLNAFRCILAHYNAFVRICTHFLRAAF